MLVFSENLACFVFLKHPFWDSPFCLITDELHFHEFWAHSLHTGHNITARKLTHCSLVASLKIWVIRCQKFKIPLSISTKECFLVLHYKLKLLTVHMKEKLLIVAVRRKITSSFLNTFSESILISEKSNKFENLRLLWSTSPTFFRMDSRGSCKYLRRRALL